MTQQMSHEEAAREYLQNALGADAPAELQAFARFDEQPLEGEGSATVFGFHTARGGQAPEEYRVVAGETEPNYYPSWSLSPDEVYSLHIGTRFMLVVGVEQFPLAELPQSFADDVTRALDGAAPGQAVTGIKVVTAFVLDGQKHAVARCRIGVENVFVICGDLPIGISRRVDLPPQVAYRLHLGKLIRIERPET